MKTRQVPVAFALVCALASPALSRDFCVQLDEGIYAGSVILLKGVRLGPRQHGPVYGYLRRFSGTSGFTDAYPVDGQAMVSSTGNLAVGLNWVAGGDPGGWRRDQPVPPVDESNHHARLSGRSGPESRHPGFVSQRVRVERQRREPRHSLQGHPSAAALTG